MKFVASTSKKQLPALSSKRVPILLYGRDDPKKAASAGAAIVEGVKREHLQPSERAWDLLSFALSVAVADAAILRDTSPDGWTREFELTVGVRDPAFWNGQKSLLEEMLRFLTTDRWHVGFAQDDFSVQSKKVEPPEETCISLLSGGMDSLVGAIDLVASCSKPLVVSHTVLGDGEKQRLFASEIGNGLAHLQLNHNATAPGEADRSQRSRSLVFLTYGVVAASALNAYADGRTVPLYVCENGLISINPPLTDARLGSNSTRTTHPRVLRQFQSLLVNAGLRVELRNPYRFKTKGEMLLECRDQKYLLKRAHEATSCGRYRRNGLKHCGRCVPCMIRRAAFLRWKKKDKTVYLYRDLGKNDSDHGRYDDVRSAAMAVAELEKEGVDALVGAGLASSLIDDKAAHRDVVARGVKELKRLLKGLKAL